MSNSKLGRQTNLYLSDAIREMLLTMANRRRTTMSEIGAELLELGAAAYAAGYRPGDTVTKPSPPAAEKPARRRGGLSSAAGMFSNVDPGGPS